MLSDDGYRALSRINEQTKLSIERSTNDIEISLSRMKSLAQEKRHLRGLINMAEETPRAIIGIQSEIRHIVLTLANHSGGIYVIEEEAEHWRKDGYEVVVTDNASINGQLVNPKDQNTVINLLIDGTEGKELRQSIINARTKLLSNLSTLTLINDKFKVPLVGFHIDPLDVEKLRERLLLKLDDKTWKNRGKDSWEAYMFEQISVYPAICLLTQLEHDAIRAVEQIVHFYEAHLDQKSLIFNDFDILIESNTPKIKLGESYQAKIALGATCDYAEFTIEVNGKPHRIIDGSSTYRSTPTKKGKQKFTASITFINPLSGERRNLKKDYFYEVY